MNELKSDNNLRQAVNRREQQLPPMPADLNERLMQRIAESEPARSETKPRRLWLYAAIAVAASIALLIVFNFGKEQTPQEPLVVQTEEQPTVSEPVEVPEPVAEVSQKDGQPEVSPSPQPVKKHEKTVRKLVELIPTSEASSALTAKTESAPEPETPSSADYSTEQDPLVAMAAQVEDIRQRGQRLQQEITALMNN